MKITTIETMQRLSSADEITFDTGFWADGRGLFYRYKKFNARVDSFVIFLREMRLHGADAASFTALNRTVFAADKYKIYTITSTLKSADTASFESLDNGYFAKDRLHIYGCDKVILGADMASFLVVAPKKRKNATITSQKTTQIST